MKTKTEKKEDVKSEILQKCEERFSYYGFNKTTMAEIAKDCDMSAANLYRYFENKEEIGVSIAQQCMLQKDDMLREIIQRADLNAKEMLEIMVIDELRYLHSELTERAKISELIEFITQNHMNIVTSCYQKKKSFIAGVIAKGNASGEFNAPDIMEAAEIFFTATMRFWHPPLFFAFEEPLESIEEQAKKLVKQLVRGLS